MPTRQQGRIGGGVELQVAKNPLHRRTELDELIDCVAEGRAKDFGTLMRRIEGQGIAPVTLCIAASRGYLQANYGLDLPMSWPSEYEWTLLAGILAAALLMGSVPAWRAYRQSLADGLSIRL